MITSGAESREFISRQAPRAGDMKVVVLNSVDELRKEIFNSSEAEIYIVNAVNGRFHQIRKRS